MSKLNRKGDVTITTVILIILGLAVLVMMIIGFTKGWSFFFDLFDSGPSDMQTFAKACLLYAQGTLRIDFCSYKLIGNELITCRDERILDSLRTDGIDTGLASLNCNGISDKLEVKRTACATLAPNRNDTKIDNTTCGELG